MTSLYITLLILVVVLRNLEQVSSNNVPQTRKQKEIVGKKIKELVQMSSSNHAIALNSDKFKRYVRQQPRNYSIIVMFTALNPQRRCHPCIEGAESFDVAWYSWKQSPDYVDKKGLFFLTKLDFEDGMDIFQNYGFKQAPVFMHFAPNGKHVSQDEFDGYVKGFSPDSLVRWISERVKIEKFKVVKPLDLQFIITLVGIVGVVLIILVTQYERLQRYIGRTHWACVVLLITLYFMSGEMWTRIRQPPYYGKDRHGKRVYFTSSQGSQYGIETFIMMILYGGCTVGMVLLYSGPRLFEKRPLKQFVAVSGLLIYFGFANFILAVFSSKYDGYPYNYLFNL